MWIKEMGELYAEGWSDKLSGPTPKKKGGWHSPEETAIGLSYKGTFGRGGGDMNVKTFNTFEQEEETSISKSAVMELVQQELNSLTDSGNDSVATLALKTLQSKINKL